MDEENPYSEFLTFCTAEEESHPSFHLYAAAAKDTERPDLSGFDGAPVEEFKLEDGNWNHTIKVYEIGPVDDLDPEELPGLLKELLQSAVDGGADLAFCMFDGAFDSVEDLGSEWGARNVYAVQAKKTEPEVRLSARDAPDWQENIRHAVESSGLTCG